MGGKIQGLKEEYKIYFLYLLFCDGMNSWAHCETQRRSTNSLLNNLHRMPPGTLTCTQGREKILLKHVLEIYNNSRRINKNYYNGSLMDLL